MIELEVSLVKAFGWSLDAIDKTSIESLLPFVFGISGGREHRTNKKYCDEVPWL